MRLFLGGVLRLGWETWWNRFWETHALYQTKGFQVGWLDLSKSTQVKRCVDFGAVDSP